MLLASILFGALLVAAVALRFLAEDGPRNRVRGEDDPPDSAGDEDPDVMLAA